MTKLSSGGLGRIRRTADQVLTDAVVITRDGTRETSLTTGEVTRSSTTVFSGRALVTAATQGTDVTATEVGRRKRTESDFRCRLPLAAADNETGDPNDVAVGDIVTVAYSADPGMGGRIFRVEEVRSQTYSANRRLIMVAYTPAVRT